MDKNLDNDEFQNENDENGSRNEKIANSNFRFDCSLAFLANKEYVSQLVLLIECLQQYDLDTDKLILGNVAGLSVKRYGGKK